MIVNKLITCLLRWENPLDGTRNFDQGRVIPASCRVHQQGPAVSRSCRQLVFNLQLVHAVRSIANEFPTDVKGVRGMLW